METNIMTVSVAVVIFVFTYKNVPTGKVIAHVSFQSNINETDIFYQDMNLKEFGITETLLVEDVIRSSKQKKMAVDPTIKNIGAAEINMLREMPELGQGIFSQKDFFYIPEL
jgi:hypothetical protein